MHAQQHGAKWDVSQPHTHEKKNSDTNCYPAFHNELLSKFQSVCKFNHFFSNSQGMEFGFLTLFFQKDISLPLAIRGTFNGNSTMKPDHAPNRGESNRFGFLLALFIVQLITTPLVEGSLAAGYAADSIFYLFLAAAAYSVRKNRFFKLTIVLGVCTILGEASGYFTDSKNILIASNFISCTYLGLVTFLIASAVARQRKISADSVMGGLCVYVLLGIFWTILFVNIELLKPGSFSFGVHGQPQDMVTIYKLMFFYSYVTLLTIGYGEVVALSGMAQTLTILEGIIGQFYLIFFMASLVGLYVSERQFRRFDNRK